MDSQKIAEFSIKLLVLLLIQLWIIFSFTLVYSLTQTDQYNQTETTNITGNAETTLQSEIDSYLNFNADGLTWNVTEAQVGATSTYPVANQNFTSDSSGWVYGEVDADGVATGAWETTGGHYDPGVFHMRHDDTLATANPTSEQWINYSFSVTTIPSSAKVYAWYELVTDDDTDYHAEVRLILPNSTEVTLYTSPTVTAAGDTGWVQVNVDASSYFTQTGTYTLKLYVQTGPAPKNADKPTNDAYWDDAGVELVMPTYGLAVEHNATNVSYSGTLKTINVSINFTSTTNDDYNLSIFDFVNNLWDSAPCQNVSVAANNYLMVWCNVTTNPTNYLSSDGKIRVRLNSTPDTDQGMLKEEYVQYYVSYQLADTQPPTWSNMVTDNPTSYDPTKATVFNITWQDDVQVDTVLIEGNWSGTPQNYTMSLASGTLQNGIWTYSQVLPAGTFYWKSYANDTSNNWNSSNVVVFTINKATPLIHLALNGTEADRSYTYPEAVNATGWVEQGDASATEVLYRNNTQVATGSPATEIATLPAGYWNYTYVYQESQNYTSASITRFAQVNKGPTQTYLYINGSRANIVVGQGDTLNFTVVTNVSGRNVELWTNYSDGVYKRWDGPSLEPLTNLTTLDTIGTWEFTGNFSGDENYTASYESWIVEVLSVYPQWSNNKTSPASPALWQPSQHYQFNITWQDDKGIDTVLIEHNFTGSFANYTMSKGAAINAGYEYFYDYYNLSAGTYAWRSYANDTDGHWNASDLFIFIVKPRSLKIYQYVQVVNWTNDNITYNLTVIVYNNDSLTFQNISVNLDPKFGDTITIDSLDPGQEAKLSATNLSQRPSGHDEWFNITPANLSGNFTGSSNKIDTILPVDPPTKIKGYLEVHLVAPDYNIITNVVQNTTFWVNATVVCRNSLVGCQSVNGTVLYNATSANPDTPVNTTFGAKPFFINETPAYATKSCGDLALDQQCNLSWLVNASGDINTYWKIGTFFNSSSSNVKSNYSENATVSITSCVVDMTTYFNVIDFGTLQPNTYNNSAPGNSNSEYNVSVNPGSCNLDIYIKGTNLTNSSLSTIIEVSNLTFSNQSNDVATTIPLSSAYKLVRNNIFPGTNVTIWFWLNVPPVYAGVYNGTIYIEGVETGAPP